jgi:hypothetical protein
MSCQIGSQTENLNVFWVQEKNPHILSYFLKKSRQANPLQVSQGALIKRDTRLQDIFTSLLICLYLSFRFPGKAAPPCSLTGSAWIGILRHQSHLVIYSCMSVGVPKKEPYIWGKTCYRPRSPTQTEGLHTVVCVLVPQGGR